MAELDHGFDEHDLGGISDDDFDQSLIEELNEIPEIPDNLQPDEDNIQTETSEPDEDNIQTETSEPDEENVQPENSEPDEGNEQNENPEHDEENVQAEVGTEPEEKQVQNSNAVVEGGEKKWPGWPGESVFRLLVPTQKVGGIIGRKGELIKKICEETKARIKVLDGPPGITERAVMVSAKEEPEASVPPAVDGLLRVLKRVVDGLDNDPSRDPPAVGSKVSTRLLAPAAQAGSLIGKQGATVKSIQEASSCIVRVLGTDDLPLFALQDDRIIEVVGEPLAVYKAVELISAHLRKFVVDRSVIPMFEMQMQRPNSQMEQHHIPPAQSWGPPPQAFQQNAGGGPGYGANPHHMPPPRQHDNYYPPAEMPPRQHDNYYPPPEMHQPMEKQPHHGISAYGREAPATMHAPSNVQPAPSMITQITQQMQIPLSYADAVIGTSGSSISYIRRASGATVTIQEARGVPGEMTVEISGTASQVQTAQQLIQNSMAEAAAGSTQAQTGAPTTDQGYNQYAAPQESLYGSAPASTAQAGGYGQTAGYGQAGATYGSGYGAGYGY